MTTPKKPKKHVASIGVTRRGETASIRLEKLSKGGSNEATFVTVKKAVKKPVRPLSARNSDWMAESNLGGRLEKAFAKAVKDAKSKG